MNTRTMRAGLGVLLAGLTGHALAAGAGAVPGLAGPAIRAGAMVGDVSPWASDRLSPVVWLPLLALCLGTLLVLLVLLVLDWRRGMRRKAAERATRNRYRAPGVATGAARG